MPTHAIKAGSSKSKRAAYIGAAGIAAAMMAWSPPYASAADAAAPSSTAPAATPGASMGDAPKDRMNMRERFRERMQERRGARDGERRPQIDRKLTTDQVRDIVEGRLAMMGNANIKVGKVTAKEDGVVAVDIVTKTGALVETREISTRTGRSVEAERMRGERGRGGPERGPRGAVPGRDLKLTTDQVRKLAEARLIMRANPNLKVGAVKEKDADTITVDIVAADNSLVMQQEINRHTGRPRRGA